MNKKLLLVALLPVGMNAGLADIKKDVQGNVDFAKTCLNTPFDRGWEHRANTLAQIGTHAVAQVVVNNTVTALDAKFLAKTFIDNKYVTVTSGDVLTFVAAVTTTCAAEKVKGKDKSLTPKNAAAHATTRGIVALLAKGYNWTAAKAEAFLGFNALDVEKAVNETLPKAAAQIVNSMRSAYLNAVVYSVVKNEVDRWFAPFGRRPVTLNPSLQRPDEPTALGLSS